MVDNNGWPRVGKYMGCVIDGKPDPVILFCPPALEETARDLLEPEHQRRRVYQDELDNFNSWPNAIDKIKRQSALETFQFLIDTSLPKLERKTK